MKHLLLSHPLFTFCITICGKYSAVVAQPYNLYFYELNATQTITGPGSGEQFGYSIQLTPDGSSLAVCSDLANGGDGALYAYYNDGTTWLPYADPVINGQGGAEGKFCRRADITTDGKTIAAGARSHSSGGEDLRGIAQVWYFDETSWSQVGTTFKGDRNNANVGNGISISNDGTRYVTGGTGHLGSKGAAVAFIFDAGINDWTQLGTDMRGDQNNDKFGFTSEMSGDGSTIAVSSKGDRRYIKVMRYDDSLGDWVMMGMRFEMPGNKYMSRSMWLNDDGTIFAYGAFDSNAGIARVFNWDVLNNVWVQMGSDLTDSDSNYGIG